MNEIMLELAARGAAGLVTDPFEAWNQIALERQGPR